MYMYVYQSTISGGQVSFGFGCATSSAFNVFNLLNFFSNNDVVMMKHFTCSIHLKVNISY